MIIKKELRVGIDARLATGVVGGVEQFIIGLASSLSKLKDKDIKYFFLVYEGQDEWLKPYLGDNSELLYSKPTGKVSKIIKFRFLRKAWHYLIPHLGSEIIKIPVSDGVIEKASIDVMHFTMQLGFLTKIPSIYHPWDLQHLHLPEFFTKKEILFRQVLYQRFCEQAKSIIVAASWIKNDLIKHYKIESSKIKTIPVGPVLNAYIDPSNSFLDTLKEKYFLPEKFIFYPAQTWPHKNHIKLLEALALIKDNKGIEIPLICTGQLNDHYQNIKKYIFKLHLQKQVKFLGFLEPPELKSLYKLAHCMIFPSLFEGWGMPTLEAFISSVPVGCSNVTCLPEQVGDAALLFNPENKYEIADVIHELWTNEPLRKDLKIKGAHRASLFNWEKLAVMFQDCYKYVYLN